jgi:hypothetical protein
MQDEDLWQQKPFLPESNFQKMKVLWLHVLPLDLELC